MKIPMGALADFFHSERGMLTLGVIVAATAMLWYGKIDQWAWAAVVAGGTGTYSISKGKPNPKPQPPVK